MLGIKTLAALFGIADSTMRASEAAHPDSFPAHVRAETRRAVTDTVARGCITITLRDYRAKVGGAVYADGRIEGTCKDVTRIYEYLAERYPKMRNTFVSAFGGHWSDIRLHDNTPGSLPAIVTLRDRLRVACRDLGINARCTIHEWSRDGTGEIRSVHMGNVPPIPSPANLALSVRTQPIYAGN